MLVRIFGSIFLLIFSLMALLNEDPSDCVEAVRLIFVTEGLVVAGFFGLAAMAFAWRVWKEE